MARTLLGWDENGMGWPCGVLIFRTKYRRFIAIPASSTAGYKSNDRVVVSLDYLRPSPRLKSNGLYTSSDFHRHFYAFPHDGDRRHRNSRKINHAVEEIGKRYSSSRDSSELKHIN